MKVLSKFILLTTLISGHITFAQSTLDNARANCQKFLTKLSGETNFESGFLKVPRDYKADARPLGRKKQTLFYWKRVGTNQAVPPLVFFHGGPGGDSSFILDLPGMQKLLANYPGDFFAFDLRGEGCSKMLNSNLHPSEYAHLSVVNVANDVEYLRRKNFFGSAKIRIFGQSRGSATVQHYFSMFPESVDAAFAHGFSISSYELGIKGVLNRANGYLNAWREYAKRYPQDEALIKQIKNSIAPTDCFTGLDNMKICGPESVGVYGISLSRQSSFEGIHNGFLSMLDEAGQVSKEKIAAAITARWKLTVYKEFNYIMGTNGMDLASLGERWTAGLRSTRSASYFEAPFSEIRFLNEAIVKDYINSNGNRSKLSKNDLVEDYKTINFKKMATSLANDRSKRFYLFASAQDPIAPLSEYDYLRKQLDQNPNFIFTALEGDHGDFSSDTVINIILSL